MHLFWERGYDGASFQDLTTVMGINASSFRNTFKTKEALYREATDAYVEEAGTWFAGVLSQETDVSIAFRRLFEETAVLFTRNDQPSGCMISLAGTHSAPSFASVGEIMTAHRATAEALMAGRLKQGQEDGQIDKEVDILVLAAFFNTLFRGMAVQARDGATQDRLSEIAKVAMTALLTFNSKEA
jgi:AcrR family transcriptional regulator